MVLGAEDVRYAPTVDEEIKSVYREIMDHAMAEQAAREAAEAGRSDAEKRTARLAELRMLRDARLGRR